jgi:hypothetical protein
MEETGGAVLADTADKPREAADAVAYVEFQVKGLGEVDANVGESYEEAAPLRATPAIESTQAAAAEAGTRWDAEGDIVPEDAADAPDGTANSYAERATGIAGEPAEPVAKKEKKKRRRAKKPALHTTDANFDEHQGEETPPADVRAPAPPPSTSPATAAAEGADLTASSGPEPSIEVGDEVFVFGLQSAKVLNGLRGRVVKAGADSSRLGVKLEGMDDPKAVKPENLRRIKDPPPEEGDNRRKAVHQQASCGATQQPRDMENMKDDVKDTQCAQGEADGLSRMKQKPGAQTEHADKYLRRPTQPNRDTTESRFGEAHLVRMKQVLSFVFNYMQSPEIDRLDGMKFTGALLARFGSEISAQEVDIMLRAAVKILAERALQARDSGIEDWRRVAGSKILKDLVASVDVSKLKVGMNPAVENILRRAGLFKHD